MCWIFYLRKLAFTKLQAKQSCIQHMYNYLENQHCMKQNRLRSLLFLKPRDVETSCPVGMAYSIFKNNRWLPPWVDQEQLIPRIEEQTSTKPTASSTLGQQSWMHQKITHCSTSDTRGFSPDVISSKTTWWHAMPTILRTILPLFWSNPITTHAST